MKYSWIYFEGTGDYFLIDKKKRQVASIGKEQIPNCQFNNEVPDVDIVMEVAKKLSELGWDKLFEEKMKSSPEESVEKLIKVHSVNKPKKYERDKNDSKRID